MGFLKNPLKNLLLLNKKWDFKWVFKVGFVKIDGLNMVVVKDFKSVCSVFVSVNF